MGSKIDAALALAERGFKVFPVKAGAKFPPLWRDWPTRATTASAEIRTAWEKQRSANIGIHCEGMVGLDVDVRSGGNETLATLDLPPTLTTITPTGGRHLFYRLPEGHPGVPNGANKLGPGIDVKSTRGYVMAPGSEVPAGRYRFEADVPIADAPEWLVHELGTSAPREQKEIVDVPDAPPEVVERARDWIRTRPVGDEAFKTACGLRDFGLSHEQAFVLLSEHDGRHADTLGPKVTHAYRYAQNDPGTKAASADEFPIVESSVPKRDRKKAVRLTELAKQSNRENYLVKGILNRNSHAVGYGRPGAGKTFVFLDLAYHIAAGREWQGRRVRQGLALYLAYEGVGGMVKRAAAITRKHGDEDVPLYILGADYNLREPAGRKALGEDLAQLPEKPALVVIDTLARAMKGGDENSAQDMGALNDAVSALIQATGACVLLVHHSGKNRSNGARGSSALLGAIDTELEIDERQILTRKQRDVEPAPPLGFKLQPVAVGTDEDGEEVMSCVVEPSAPVADRTAGLKGNTQLVWDVLCNDFEDNTPVTLELWRAACSGFLPEKEDSKRKSFYRSLTALQRKGLVDKTEDGKWQRRLEG